LGAAPSSFQQGAGVPNMLGTIPRNILSVECRNPDLGSSYQQEGVLEMCPACFASATFLIATTISTGAVSALTFKFLKLNNRNVISRPKDKGEVKWQPHR
jgi:hypothetical protein